MKFLIIIALIGLIGCEEKKSNSYEQPSPVKEPSVESVKELSINKTKGEICDLHDDEEREMYRIFLVSDTDGDRLRFYRVNDNEDLAYPGLRTANLDLMYMFKASESDNFRHVSLLEKIYFKDNGIWRSYSEVIKAFEGQHGDKYILRRTRFLRDKDKHTQKDWEETNPEPFRVSFCRDAEVEIRMEWLPRRRGW